MPTPAWGPRFPCSGAVWAGCQGTYRRGGGRGAAVGSCTPALPLQVPLKLPRAESAGKGADGGAACSPSQPGPGPQPPLVPHCPLLVSPSLRSPAACTGLPGCSPSPSAGPRDRGCPGSRTEQGQARVRGAVGPGEGQAALHGGIRPVHAAACSLGDSRDRDWCSRDGQRALGHSAAPHPVGPGPRPGSGGPAPRGSQPSQPGGQITAGAQRLQGRNGGEMAPGDSPQGVLGSWDPDPVQTALGKAWVAEWSSRGLAPWSRGVLARLDF